MIFSLSKKSWVYVVVSNPGENEKLTGFQDKNGSTFIPILKTKNDAEGFLGYMPREPGVCYELQTIIVEDILKYARENRSFVYVVNKKGEILESWSPDSV
jgi:hypothetical protein